MSNTFSTAVVGVPTTFEVPAPDGFVHLSMLERILLCGALEARWPTEPRSRRLTVLLGKLQPTAAMLAANGEIARREREALAARRAGATAEPGGNDDDR